MTSTKTIRQDAIAIWQAGVDAVHGSRLVEDFVSCDSKIIRFGEQRFEIDNCKRIVVVGFGKASGAMAKGLETAFNGLPSHIEFASMVNVPDNQVPPTSKINVVGVRPPGKNLPTSRAIDSTRTIIELVRSTGPNDICICLISGGGSALLEYPTEPITLEEFRSTTELLSSAGASIYELNAVRRAISQVKGGGLARELMSSEPNATLVSLIISDVIGDELDVIASGPTVESQSQITAVEVLKKFAATEDSIPDSVWHVIQESEIAPKPPHTSDETNRVFNFIIGNIETATAAANKKASELGYESLVATPNGNEGDAESVGREIPMQIASMNREPTKKCFIQGGETTVTLCQSPGQGGRNQHLVLSTLAALVELEDFNATVSSYCLLSGGTDGEDGTVSVAGAMIDDAFVETALRPETGPDTIAAIKKAIANCDSHTFFSDKNCLLAPQKTWTNVCDLRIVLTQPRRSDDK